MQQWRLTRSDELVYRVTETLSETRQQVQSNHDKRPIGFLEVVGIRLEGLVLLQARLDDGQTSLVDRLGVWGECDTGGDRHRGETLGR